MAVIGYCIFETRMGWVGIAATDAGICRTTLPQPSVAATQAVLGEPDAGEHSGASILADTRRRFLDYYAGNPIDFPEKIDTSQATPYQREVWDLARRIPYGQTRSYGWLARQLRNPGAARAVGRAMNRNPLPIIVPCHRVISSDGRLGGFRSGTDLKQRLLTMEATALRRISAAAPAAPPGSSA
jgi:methylated-DNA-[protein]-cysteine S-methyltransferase